MIGNLPQSHDVTTRTCQRHPFFRRLQHLYWLVVTLVASWFVLASLGVIPFQVTQAKLETRQQNPAPPLPPLQPGAPFGKMSIPRIGLSAAIVEGHEANLPNAVGYVRGTAASGNAAKVLLAARRNAFCRGLAQVRLDDIILLDTTQGTYRYRVANLTIANPPLRELPRSREFDLTLVGRGLIHGGGPSQQTYVLHATRL